MDLFVSIVDPETPKVTVSAGPSVDSLTLASVGHPRESPSLKGLNDWTTYGPLKTFSDLGIVKTDLTGTYWLTFRDLESKNAAIKSGIFDSLTVVPQANAMQAGKRPKPICLLYSHPSKPMCLGVPRFWGLSQFGSPTVDHRKSHEASVKYTFQGTLRPLQEQCVTMSMDMLRKWGGATVLADCGYGKTATSIYLALSLQQRCLILCNREILMTQWIDAIRTFAPIEAHSQIGFLQSEALLKGPDGTVRPKPKERASFDATFFTVASIESVSECDWSDVLRGYGTVIVDEMHHIAAQSLAHTLPLVACKYVIGLTATPDRSDGLEHVLYWLAGPVAFVYQRLPSITGVCGSVEVFQHRFFQGAQREVVYRNGSLGFANMMTFLSEDEARNDALCSLIRKALDERDKVIVVTTHVAHAKGLFDRQLSDRQAIMAGPHLMPVEAKSEVTRLVFATYALLEEGYDDPRLDALVLAMPRSRIQQTVGRIERTHPGKKVPRVYDLVDEFSLFPAMANKRSSFFKSRGFTIHSTTTAVH